MENFRLWEQYTAKMMQATLAQTLKQTDALQKQMGENIEQFVHVWQEPPAVSEAKEAQEKEEQATSQKETPPTCSEPVWTYRGYQLQPGNFTNAMVHFFRAESYRADLWRRRLDTTTNWAVITTGATLSLAWDPRIVIVSTLLVTLFLFIEARRYRHYELWSYRVRLLETDFFAAMLVPPFRPASDWAESIAENLLRPRFPISMWEAFGRRFRRNYIWIYLILWLAWLLNIWLHPTTVTTWSEFAQRAAIGTIPAWAVLLTGILFNGSLILTGILTQHLNKAPGEIFPSDEELAEHSPPARSATKNKEWNIWNAWFRPSRQREQSLAFIITDSPQAISEAILHKMRRGVTALSGTGMYSQQNHAVLMCALTETEIDSLKNLIKESDPRAFLVMSPAQQILGEGFLPLQTERQETAPPSN